MMLWNIEDKRKKANSRNEWLVEVRISMISKDSTDVDTDELTLIYF